MIRLHASWGRTDCLHIWAEDTVEALERRPARGRPAKRPRPKVHPFAARTDVLAGSIASVEFGAHPGSEPASDLTLWLPTDARGPVASASCTGTDSERRWLAPWTVPAVSLTATRAARMLLQLDDADAQRSVSVSDSLHYFALVAKLAVEVVAGGRVVPVLVLESGNASVGAANWRAIWCPTPTAHDRERLGKFAEAMPALCRAEASHGRDGAPAATILEACFTRFVDAEVRRVLPDRILGRRRGRAPRRLAVEESFVEALSGDIGVVDGDPAALELLAKTLDTWRSSLGMPGDGRVRTCFRLAPPTLDAQVDQDDLGRGAGAAQTWQLEFLLQDSDDPSLLVSAADVWDASTTMPAGDDPQVRLLSDLGAASRFYPELEAALADGRPETLALDADGALAFLSLAAGVLSDAGFGVLVPKTWDGRLRARVRTKSATESDVAVQTQSRLGADQIVDYKWEIALGDDTLTADELHALADLKAPLVQVRGEWVHLRADEIERALQIIDRQERGETDSLTAGDLVQATLGLSDLDTGLEVETVLDEGWLADIFNAEDEHFEAEPTPARMRGTLRAYQERGVGWLGLMARYGLGACLADDMGLGKTIQFLALMLAERSQASGRDADADAAGPTLLVCPMSVVGNWQREAERFAPSLDIYVHHGGRRAAGDEFTRVAADADLVLTTYALVARDIEALGTVKWHRVVLDEAQNIKNSRARQSRAVRSLPATQRIALTGTPIENRLSELWSILEFLNPGFLGAAETFRRRFAIPIERYGDDDAAATLRRVTAPFILRRLKTDKSIISDLPDKIEIKAYCNLTREQATLYQAVVDDMLAKVEAADGIERRGLVLATMVKLKQVCNHPAHFIGDGSGLAGRSGKLAHLEVIIDEVLAADEKVLVFTQFAEMGVMLTKHLRERFGRDVLFLHGGVTKRARDLQTEQFAASEGPPIFVLSLKAGGVGLNLTAANHVVHYDRWWNPAVEDQASDRAFRIGQRKNVQVRKFVCIGTLEERIDEMIDSKKDLADRIVGTGEDVLTKLSTDELRAVISLGRDAVGEEPE